MWKMVVNKPLLALHHQAFGWLRSVLPSPSFKFSFIWQFINCCAINCYAINCAILQCTWTSPFTMLFLWRLRFSIVKWRSCSSLSWAKGIKHQHWVKTDFTKMNTNPQNSIFKTGKFSSSVCNLSDLIDRSQKEEKQCQRHNGPRVFSL